MFTPKQAVFTIITEVDSDEVEPIGFVYRPDSRLIIIEGMPNEDENRNGLSYYLIEHGRFRLIRFYAFGDMCEELKPVPG